MTKKTETETFLTPEERAMLPLVPATEEVPDIGHRRWGEGFVVESDGTAPPTIDVHLEELRRTRHGTQWWAELRLDEAEARVLRVGEQKGHLAAEELKELARAENIDPRAAYRPDWLNLRYHPNILPRYRRLRASDLSLGSIYAPGALTLYRGELAMLNDWPWCTIGKLFVGPGRDYENPTSVGSGVLVGPNLMLTASHAAPWDFDEWWMRFVPAYRDGVGLYGLSSYVRQFYGVRHADDNSDYVICELYEPLGATCGWMGSWASTDDDFYEDRGWDSVGYPSDFAGGQRPAVEWNITPEDADVSGREVEITFSSPFSSGGWSGGPLFGWINDAPRVVGILRGTKHIDYWVTSDDDALFTGGLHMVDLIKYGLANWPA